MTTSPYFNNYYATNEQDLIENIVIESIQHKGIDMIYIERNQENIDHLFCEDPSNWFKEKAKIEMYPVEVDGFGGDGEMLTKFGLELRNSATFVVSKKRFAQEVPSFTRPREGDILFMPITNAILEIRHVVAESPFFEKGKQYVWNLKVESFVYGHEDFVVEDQEALDAINAMEVSHIGDSDYSISDDPYADNVEIEEEADSRTYTDPNNPFGIN